MDNDIPKMVDLFAFVGLGLLLVALCLILFPPKARASSSALSAIRERPDTVRSFEICDPLESDVVLRVTFLCGRRAVVAHGDEALRMAEMLGNRGVPMSGPGEIT